jgi:single-stranded DNA-binding protein
MSVAVLVSGALFRAPERKTSQAGKSYVRATLKVQSTTDNGSDFWSLMVFSETTGTALLELADGDRVAVQGTLKVGIYNNKVQRTCFVDQVLPLRAKKKRQAKLETAADTTAGTSEPPFDDAIPF